MKRGCFLGREDGKLKDLVTKFKLNNLLDEDDDEAFGFGYLGINRYAGFRLKLS